MSENEPSGDVRATTESQPAGAKTLPIVLMAWLVPGAGHFMLGRRGLATMELKDGR